MADEYRKPLPSPSALSQPYWHGLSEGQVRVQRCSGCGEYVFYPRPHCPACLSEALEWVAVSGRGRVYTYTVVRRAMNPAFADDVPYVYAIVELEEGPRLMTNVVGCAPEDVRVDMPVKAVYDSVTSEITLLKFEPAG
jgi:uncharacterized OB-fold protein